MESEMLEHAYAAELLAGIFYIGVGARLLRLARRTREVPERLLGLYFAATGVCYVIYFVPELAGSLAFVDAWRFASRLAYFFAVVAILTFTRVTFRPDDRWAKGLAGLLVLVMCGGLVIAAINGAWDAGVESVGWWLEFGAYSAALAWFAWEAFSAWGGARKRVRIGLCDGVGANRFLLVALFGAFQVGACFAELAVELESAGHQAASALADGVLGAVEVAGIAMLWLAFFSPEWYQRWVTRRLPAATGADG
jgi:hypothetical protein